MLISKVVLYQGNAHFRLEACLDEGSVDVDASELAISQSNLLASALCRHLSALWPKPQQDPEQGSKAKGRMNRAAKGPP